MKQKTLCTGSLNELHKQIIKVCHERRMPLHYNKTGHKHFNNYQRVALIILLVRSGKSIRTFLEEFKETRWNSWLQLRYIPSKSTLHNWLELFDTAEIRKLHSCTLDDEDPELTAMDATGLDSNISSKHYQKRLKEFGLLKKQSPFAKLDILIDIRTLMIIDFVLRLRPRHDVIGAEAMLRRNHLRGIKVIGDKGYDSERLHRIVRRKGGTFYAPVRNKSSRTKGFNRRKCKTGDVDYTKRNMVETVFSMIKRTQINALRSRKAYMKKREEAWHMLLYNMNRISSFFIHLFFRCMSLY